METITVTKQQLISIFLQWNTEWLKNGNDPKEEIVATKEVAEAQADYFIECVKNLKT